jgi:hypothetical protein
MDEKALKCVLDEQDGVPVLLGRRDGLLRLGNVLERE